jgi:hypothetical protein
MGIFHPVSDFFWANIPTDLLTYSFTHPLSYLPITYAINVENIANNINIAKTCQCLFHSPFEA